MASSSSAGGGGVKPDVSAPGPLANKGGPRARHMPAALSISVWRRAWQRLRRGLHAPGGLAEHALPALSVLTRTLTLPKAIARYGTQGPDRHRRATCRLPITAQDVDYAARAHLSLLIRTRA